VTKSQNPLARELVIGQWVPVRQDPQADLLDQQCFEEITTKASFKSSWTYGKRRIIPAVSFDESNWEPGKNSW
jgi:hypothetical protein